LLAITGLGEPLTLIKMAGLTLALLATWLLLGGETAANLVFKGAQYGSLIQVAIATVAFGSISR